MLLLKFCMAPFKTPVSLNVNYLEIFPSVKIEILCTPISVSFMPFCHVHAYE